MVWGWGWGRHVCVWYKGCSMSAKEPCSTKSNRAIKKITIWSLYKRSNGNKKMTISRFYLHSENDTSDSRFLSTLSPPPVFLSSSSSLFPLSLRETYTVLLQSVHMSPFSACTSIYVCVCMVCVCVHRGVLKSVITSYGGPEAQCTAS